MRLELSVSTPTIKRVEVVQVCVEYLDTMAVCVSVVDSLPAGWFLMQDGLISSTIVCIDF